MPSLIVLRIPLDDAKKMADEIDTASKLIYKSKDLATVVETLRIVVDQFQTITSSFKEVT